MPDYAKAFATGTLSPDPAVAKAQKAEHKKAAQRENVLKLQHSRGPIPRGRKPIAKRSKKRRADDARIYGPELFRTFLHNHECLGCGYRGKPEEIQQAHVHTGGMSRKDDWERTGPLCGPRLVQPNPHDHREDYVAPGCHHDYDHAKKSWRSWKGRTFAIAQRLFFAEWERHAVMVRKLKGANE
jgi:hypothetical protein